MEESPLERTWPGAALPALDLETTGLGRYGEDSIVQAALVAVTPDGEVVGNSISTLVQPTTPMGEKAEQIHGISFERATEEGEPAADVVAAMAERIRTAHERGFPIVIHNALYDWPFFLSECERHGVPQPWGVRVIDTKLIEAGLLGRHRGTSLDACLRRYKVTGRTTDTHGAEEDAVLTRLLLAGMTRRHKWLEHTPLSNLWKRQIEWHGQLGGARGAGGVWPTGRHIEPVGRVAHQLALPMDEELAGVEDDT